MIHIIMINMNDEYDMNMTRRKKERKKKGVDQYEMCMHE